MFHMPLMHHLLNHDSHDSRANWSDQYGSFDTHITKFHDILCFMASVQKCHKMPKNGILWHFLTDAVKNKTS